MAVRKIKTTGRNGRKRTAYDLATIRSSGYNTSSAYKLDEHTGRSERLQSHQRSRRGKTNEPLQSETTQYVFYKNEYGKIAKEAYFLLIVIFMGCLGMIFSGTMTWSKKSEIYSLKSEITRLEKANASLETELYENFDEIEIEKIATMKLGMIRPAASQMIHVNIPKNTKTVYSMQTEHETANEPAWLSWLLGHLPK